MQNLVCVYMGGVVDLCRVLLKYTHEISLGLINLWECGNPVSTFMNFISLIWPWDV